MTHPACALVLAVALLAGCDGATLLGNDQAEPLSPRFPARCGADTVRVPATGGAGAVLVISEWCLWATDDLGRARPGDIGAHGLWNLRGRVRIQGDT